MASPQKLDAQFYIPYKLIHGDTAVWRTGPENNPPTEGRAQRPYCAPGSTINLAWEVSEAANILTAFPDAPGQVKKSCNKRKIAFTAETDIKVQMWWNQSGRSKKIKEALLTTRRFTALRCQLPGVSAPIPAPVGTSSRL
jgi:hypothetical protein